MLISQKTNPSGDSNERFALVDDALDNAVDEARLNTIEVSALLLFVGTLLHGFGDFLYCAVRALFS